MKTLTQGLPCGWPIPTLTLFEAYVEAQAAIAVAAIDFAEVADWEYFRKANVRHLRQRDKFEAKIRERLQEQP